ncbi:CAP domain-containing protein [Tateyamaria sp. SN3-11]|uniref:CAP domain-containing protein n=1 Tax=Tateyamaria sp. SN3-11 TaxID=3092147 RepID=UPI0039E8721F
MSVASQFERQMLDLINQERAARGIDALTLELRLNDASEDHSAWMDDTLTFSHTGAGGSDPGDRMRAADFEFSGNWTWGENIAYQSERGAPGISDDVIDLHNSLMNSPGHRANILNPAFELIGIGIEVGDNRGFDAVYVTQKFARTSAPVELDEPGTTPTTPTGATQGDDLLVGDDGADRLWGKGGDDTIHSGDGNDVVNGGADDDSLFAEAGNDTVLGGDGDDTMFAGSGNDDLRGGDGDDEMSGGSGSDILLGEAGDDALNGGGASDRLNGGSGQDVLIGGSGHDQLRGGANGDRLNGGAGNDKMAGQGGADVFVFSTGRDTVTDFDPSKAGERIDLRDVASITSYSDMVKGGHLSESNGNVVISDLAGNTLELVGISATDLQVNDFLF